MTVNDANVTFNVSNSYTSPYTNFPITEFTIGNSQLYYGGRLFYGYVQEVLLYTSALTTAQRSSVKTYLARKWGNANINSVVALPVGHPNYYNAPSARMFNPPDIGGCALWLDAADVTTITGTTTVTAWADKSGSGNNFTTTAGTVSTATDSGYSVLSFPGGAIMSSTNQITFTTSSAFYVVFRATGLYSTFNMVLAFTNIYSGDFSIRLNSSGLIGTAAAAGNANDLANSTYYVNGSLNPSFPYSTYSNAYAVVGTVAPLIGGTSYVTLSSSFGTRYFGGYMAEVLYYPAGLTSTQRQQVEGYLAWKWGKNSSLPSTHPSFNFPANTALPFIPSDVATCALWLDSAGPSSTNFVLSGTTITEWVDKSGNGRSLGNPSGTVSYITGGGVQLGGSMYVVSAVDLTTFTFFIVAKATTTTTNQGVFCARPVAGGTQSWNSVDGFGFYMDGQTAIRLYGQSSAGQYVTYSATTSSPSLFSFQSSGTTVSGWFNGVSQTGGTMASTRTSTAQGFGLGLEWGGTSYVGASTAIVYEIIVYNGVITTQARQIIEGYLAQKWKI
jgi:hypothetical protein